jgi:hypothetical protein
LGPVDVIEKKVLFDFILNAETITGFLQKLEQVYVEIVLA